MEPSWSKGIGLRGAASDAANEDEGCGFRPMSAHLSFVTDRTKSANQSSAHGARGRARLLVAWLASYAA